MKNKAKLLKYHFSRLLDKYLGGHISIGSVTIYGWNAMHLAVNIRGTRWGTICFHPTMYMFDTWWPWYFYVSPNSTPWASTFAIGPGVDRSDKAMATLRRYLFGHNFYPGEDFSKWNADYRGELEYIRWRNHLSDEDKTYLAKKSNSDAE